MDDIADLEALESLVLEGDDLAELESLIGRFNVFHALNVARAEIRHSTFLAWMLDPAETHGLGDLFLKPLLLDLLRAAPRESRPVSPARLDGADLSGAEVHREWRHIDLLIRCHEPAFVVAIENKIDSGEHGSQLKRYRETLASEFPDTPALLMFLTPDGAEPSDNAWSPYGYDELHAVLRRVVGGASSAVGGEVAVFINQYLNLIGTELMDDPQIDELCQRIYKNHKRAIDLIVERVGVASAGGLHAFAERLRDGDRFTVLNTTGRREDFVPTSWREWIPAVGRAKRDAQFWVRFWLVRGDRRYRFVFEIGSTTDPSVRDALLGRLIEDADALGLKKPARLTSRFTRLWNSVVMAIEDADEDDESLVDAAIAKLDSFWPNIQRIENAATEALAAYR